MPSSTFPLTLQNKFMGASRSSSQKALALWNLDLYVISKKRKIACGFWANLETHCCNSIRNVVFFLFLFRLIRKSFYTVRGQGLVGTIGNAYHQIRLWVYSLFLRAPGVRGKVDKQVSDGITKIAAKLIPQEPALMRYRSLPKQGWSPEAIRGELNKLTELKHSMWEDGRVSGAVYHGGDDLLNLQTEAYRQFAVSNPLHPDVFPGIRKMEAEVVAMVRRCRIYDRWKCLIHADRLVTLISDPRDF